MVKEFILGLMVRSIKENSLTTRNTDKEIISIQMEAHSRDNGFKVKERVEEQEFMQMAAIIKATGRTTCKTVKVNIFQKKELFKKEIGRKINL